MSADRLALRSVRVEDEAIGRAALRSMAAEGFAFALVDDESGSQTRRCWIS